MTELTATARRVLHDLRGGGGGGVAGAAAPAALQVVVGDEVVHGWGAAVPLQLGDAGALLSASAVLALVDEGLLSVGTTVRECVPLSQVPAGVDCGTGVDELLVAVGEALAAGASPAVAASLLERIGTAACGEGLVALAASRLAGPRRLTGTVAAAGEPWVAARWCTTPADLARLAAGPAWGRLAMAGAVPASTPAGWWGVDDGLDDASGACRVSVWGCPSAAVGVAATEPVPDVVAALDRALR